MTVLTTLPFLYPMNVGMALMPCSAATSYTSPSVKIRYAGGKMTHLDLLDVEFGELDAREQGLHLGEDGRDHLAGTAPGGPVVDDNGLGAVDLRGGSVYVEY